MQTMAKTLKATILETLKELDKIKPEKRIDLRIEKFCAMGVVEE
jgi:acetyl-CoA carboxylase carboxyl transferase subunit alpha